MQRETSQRWNWTRNQTSKYMDQNQNSKEPNSSKQMTCQHHQGLMKFRQNDKWLEKLCGFLTNWCFWKQLFHKRMCWIEEVLAHQATFRINDILVVDIYQAKNVFAKSAVGHLIFVQGSGEGGKLTRRRCGCSPPTLACTWYFWSSSRTNWTCLSVSKEAMFPPRFLQ